MVAVPQDRKKMGAMEGDGTDIIPTNLGNRVQKEFLIFVELDFFFFLLPLAPWEIAQGEVGEEIPVPLSLLCTAEPWLMSDTQGSSLLTLLCWGSQLERSSCPVLARLVWTTAPSLGRRF